MSSSTTDSRFTTYPSSIGCDESCASCISLICANGTHDARKDVRRRRDYGGRRTRWSSDSTHGGPGLGKANFRAGQSGHVNTNPFRVVLFSGRLPIMPNKVVETPYPLIDADPHASRVVRYFRPSDYAAWAGSTVAFPAALYAWGKKFSQICRLPSFLTEHPEMADPTKFRMKTTLKLGGFLGFTAGFLLAYQRSSRTWILQ